MFWNTYGGAISLVGAGFVFGFSAYVFDYLKNRGQKKTLIIIDNYCNDTMTLQAFYKAALSLLPRSSTLSENRFTIYYRIVSNATNNRNKASWLISKGLKKEMLKMLVFAASMMFWAVD